MQDIIQTDYICLYDYDLMFFLQKSKFLSIIFLQKKAVE